jgi:hypothetical protein
MAVHRFAHLILPATEIPYRTAQEIPDWTGLNFGTSLRRVVERIVEWIRFGGLSQCLLCAKPAEPPG